MMNWNGKATLSADTELDYELDEAWDEVAETLTALERAVYMRLHELVVAAEEEGYEEHIDAKQLALWMGTPDAKKRLKSPGSPSKTRIKEVLTQLEEKGLLVITSDSDC